MSLSTEEEKLVALLDTLFDHDGDLKTLMGVATKCVPMMVYCTSGLVDFV
jgi:hypothetical protein